MAEFMDRIGMEEDVVLNGPPQTGRKRGGWGGRRSSARSSTRSVTSESRSRVGGLNYDMDLESHAAYTLSGMDSKGMPHRMSGSAVPSQRSRPKKKKPVDPALIGHLRAQGFSTGLAAALATNSDAFHHRIWVVDNSGSMVVGDGHRIVQTSDNKISAQPVTRWEEIQDTVVYHAKMAALLRTPTVFNLLNDPGPTVGPQKFSVGERGRNQEEDIQNARSVMNKARPEGVTPLTSHIWEIQASLRKMAPRLRRKGQRVAVILATDGLPTDAEGYGGDEITREFISSLRALEGLPVWLVIRLCTDEDNVTDFYNDLDGQLELSLEVLDDFLGEAREVHRHNKWLNYALPMHRCRELGYHDRLFDLVDERPLTKGELRDFCVLLFGVNAEIIPDPHTDWKDFLLFVKEHLKLEQNQWCPMKKKVMPWINLRTLQKVYGKGGGCTIM